MVTKQIIWEGEGMYAPRASRGDTGETWTYYRVHGAREAYDNGLGTPSVVTVHDLRWFDSVVIVTGDPWPPYMSGQDAEQSLAA